MKRELINPTDEELCDLMCGKPEDDGEEEMAKVKVDNVNHPQHYADSCSIECIESMIIAFGAEAVYDFCICNAYKYLWRHKNKNGMEDINKAIWYVNKAEWIFDTYANNPQVHFEYDGKEDVVMLRDLCEQKIV